MPDPAVTFETLGANGLDFDVRRAGPPDGPLVMLLHGFPQTGASWRESLPALARAGYHAVAPDQRGYSPGAQPHRVGDYTVDALGADVIGLADALGADRFHLVGHDWGGAVGWHLAARQPERLLSFTSVSTPHPRAMAAAMAGTQALRSLYIPFFRLPWLPERVLGAGHHRVLREGLVRSGLPRERATETVEALERSGALPWALAWYRANGPRLVRSTGPVAVPTMYVWSTGDTALGRSGAERTAGHVTGPYRFEVLEGVSHWIPETAADALNRLLVDHLADVEAGGPPP